MSGWIPQPNGRGTFDIILASITTIFLCCWTSICPNIPGPNDSRWDCYRDKFSLACLGILGPDFLVLLALGQWESARRSEKAFRSAGYSHWTLTHGFFADMGGFVLHTSDFQPFPLDSQQLLYLVSKGHITCPEVEKSDIDDKNKADGTARLIAVFQVLSFTITFIARATQNLATTTLELTTLAFVVTMLVTSILWAQKPQDIYKPIVVRSSTSIADILSQANASAFSSIYKHTPLEFLSRQEWSVNILWDYYHALLWNMHTGLFRRRISTRPLDRIPGDRFLRLSPKFEIACALLMLVYSSIFMCGWNFAFPSGTEKILWRTASLITLGMPVVGGIVFAWSDYYFFQSRNYNGNELGTGQIEQPSVYHDQGEMGNKTRRPQRTNSWKEKAVGMADRIRNNSPNKDPMLTVPIRVLLPATVICAVYSIGRAYILIQDVVGLRDLPASAFQSVDWSLYLPSI